MDYGGRRAVARRSVLPYVRLPGLFRGPCAVGRCIAVRPRGQRGQGVVRVRVVPHAAGRVREDRYGIGARPRDERLFVLDQPAGRPVQGRDGDLRPAVYHHPAERYRFGHRARVVPLRALPRRAQQVALHPGAADRRAVHLLVPAFAHDDARVDHSGLHPFAGDDERPLAPMLRLPCRAGTGRASCSAWRWGLSRRASWICMPAS